MTNYVFIESRDPFECPDTRFVTETATAMRLRGHDVTVFLVQNGVLVSRKKSRSCLDGLAEARIHLLADDFSLRERGIQAEELHPSIQTSGMEVLVDMLIQENTKAIWH